MAAQFLFFICFDVYKKGEDIIMITPISNNFSFKGLYGVNNNANNGRISFAPQYDTVEFKGRKKPPVDESNLSENAKKASCISKKLIKMGRNGSLNYKEIENLMNENSPVKLEVIDIDTLPSVVANEFGGGIQAHFLPFYNPDTLELKGGQIALGKATTTKETGALIADAVHEYTHMFQRASKNYLDTIQNVTSDFDEVITLARTAQRILQMHVAMSMENVRNSEYQDKYSQLFDDRIKNDTTVKKLLKPTDIETDIDLASKSLSENLNISEENIKKGITSWINNEAKNEVEAYDATVTTLEKWNKYDPATKGNGLVMRDIHEFIAEQTEEF